MTLPGLAAAPGWDAGARLPVSTLAVLAAAVGGVVVGVGATISWTASVVAAAGILGFLAALHSPTAVVGVLACLPALSGLRRDLPLPGLRLTEVVAVALGGAAIALFPRHRTPRLAPVDVAALGFVVVGIALPAYHSLRQGSVTEVSTAAGLLQYLIIYVAVALVAVQARSREVALRVLLISSVPVNLVGLMQAANVPGVGPWIMAITDADPNSTPGYEAVARATSIFPHWHVLAGFDLVIVLLALALWLSGERKVLSGRWLAVIGLQALFGIAVSVTATVALGLATGALLIAAMARQVGRLLRVALPLAVGTVVVFWPLLMDRVMEQGLARPGESDGLVPQTISYRWQIWTDQYLPAAAESPFAGFGLTLPDRIQFPFPENVYLALLMRGGILLFAAYVIWMWLTATMARRAASSPDANPADLATARLLFALVVVLVPMQLLFPYVFATGLAHALWFVAGLVRASQPDLHRSARGPTRPVGRKTSAVRS